MSEHGTQLNFGKRGKRRERGQRGQNSGKRPTWRANGALASADRRGGKRAGTVREARRPPVHKRSGPVGRALRDWGLYECAETEKRLGEHDGEGGRMDGRRKRRALTNGAVTLR